MDTIISYEHILSVLSLVASIVTIYMFEIKKKRLVIRSNSSLTNPKLSTPVKVYGIGLVLIALIFIMPLSLLTDLSFSPVNIFHYLNFTCIIFGAVLCCVRVRQGLLLLILVYFIIFATFSLNFVINAPVENYFYHELKNATLKDLSASLINLMISSFLFFRHYIHLQVKFRKTTSLLAIALFASSVVFVSTNTSKPPIYNLEPLEFQKLSNALTSKHLDLARQSEVELFWEASICSDFFYFGDEPKCIDNATSAIKQSVFDEMYINEGVGKDLIWASYVDYITTYLYGPIRQQHPSIELARKFDNESQETEK